jgi:hypothetical protein
MAEKSERKFEKFSDKDIDGFAEKLQDFAKTLSPAEQVLLQEMVSHTRFDQPGGSALEASVVSPQFRTNVRNALLVLGRGRFSSGFWAQWAQRQY